MFHRKSISLLVLTITGILAEPPVARYNYPRPAHTGNMYLPPPPPSYDAGLVPPPNIYPGPTAYHKSPMDTTGYHKVPATHHSDHTNDGHEPGMPFHFNYAVKDDAYGNDYAHNAASDGNAVTGEYRVQLPDGRLQIVRYTADWQTGYHAEVTYQGEASYPPPTSHNRPLTPLMGNFNTGHPKPSHTYGPPSGSKPGSTYLPPSVNKPRPVYRQPTPGIKYLPVN